jgi:hypothetical protein
MPPGPEVKLGREITAARLRMSLSKARSSDKM